MLTSYFHVYGQWTDNGIDKMKYLNFLKMTQKAVSSCLTDISKVEDLALSQEHQNSLEWKIA